MWNGVKQIISIFADKGNSRTKFRAPLQYITSSSSHFLNKTILEQYLFSLMTLSVLHLSVSTVLQNLLLSGSYTLLSNKANSIKIKMSGTNTSLYFLFLCCVPFLVGGKLMQGIF